jgi:DNA end-binding protein Ku
MRALWKGSISFGLVNIPVKMFTASREQELKFIMLHKKDMSQIRYAKMCKQEDKEIPWEEIVKGFEYQPGEYVVMNDEDFQKANLSKSKAIEIQDFVKESEIDTVYYTKPYFLEPEKNAITAYALLREALVKSKKVGIAKFVLHNREHLAVIKPYENAIVLNELRYANEIVATEELTLPSKEHISDKELAIALKLIDHLTTSFKVSKYKDTYVDEMKAIIEQKAKGKKIHPKGQEPKPTKVQDIMSLLKASLETPKESPKKAKKQKTA